MISIYENLKDFKDLWIKPYDLIWEKYGSHEAQCTLKEMSEYNSVEKKEPLELLPRVE